MQLDAALGILAQHLRLDDDGADLADRGGGAADLYPRLGERLALLARQ